MQATQWRTVVCSSLKNTRRQPSGLYENQNMDGASRLDWAVGRPPVLDIVLFFSQFFFRRLGTMLQDVQNHLEPLPGRPSELRAPRGLRKLIDWPRGRLRLMECVLRRGTTRYERYLARSKKWQKKIGEKKNKTIYFEHVEVCKK